MSDPLNAFNLNVEGVQNLIESDINKSRDLGESPEGSGEKYGNLTLELTDEELLKLRDEWEKQYAVYEGELKPKVEANLNSYLGKRPNSAYLLDNDLPIASNLQFEALETFLSAALAKNPSPVVYADNTPQGNAIADDVKIMLQYHADTLVLKRKLTIMVRQWSINHLGVLKHGWNEKTGDITTENRKIKDFIFDRKGHVDAYGCFTSYLGERITISAEKLTELFPEHETYIKQQVDNKLGTDCTYTEWWTDEYCFSTYKNKVLDKHKNEFFKYPEEAKDLNNKPLKDENNESQLTEVHNHFAYPQKPYTFLSVYSLQEQPHDITGLIEQNIPNQNLITKETEQIDFNMSTTNNSYAYSEDNFNEETAKQASNARRRGNPILIPSGGPIDKAVLPLNAQDVPNGMFTFLENNKTTLRSSWGIQGIISEPTDEDQTARGQILDQSHDTTRIGGGIGDGIQQVADNVFNWWVQLYYVFYDDEHRASVMGAAKATEYATLINSQLVFPLVVSCAPDSMKPRDEVTELNLAQAMFDKGAIGPKTLLKQVDFPNVDEAAADGSLWQVDKLAYIRINFPEMFAELQGAQQANAQEQMMQQAQATGMNTAAVAANTPPEATTEPPPPTGVSTPPLSDPLSQVPLPAI